MGIWDYVFLGIPGALVKNHPDKIANIAKSYSPAINLAESVVDNIFRDKVSEPAIGSVVYCDLMMGAVEHTGIYIGDNNIVHLDGSGLIEAVSPQVFLNRLGGLNTAVSVYVSCKNGKPVGSSNAATKAKSMIGSRKSYNLVLDNCHQFTAGCLSGDFDNSINFFNILRSEAKQKLGCNEWRVWDF